MKVAVVIPAYNEGASIGKVIRDISADVVSEIVVVNNNSTDYTSQAAQEAGAVVLNEKIQGYGAACLNGISYLKGKQCDIIVFLDGDYSDYPEEMDSLLNPIINQDYDFVIGSRVLGKREKGALPLQSRVGSIIAGSLINIFWGVKYTDLGPFRAIKYNKLVDLIMTDKWYGWTVEMQINAAKKKYKILEVPVSYRKRIGRSKVTGTIKGSFMAGIVILKTIIKYIFVND
jgi:glycosyltransferase involved in cell wall biosynthesis